MHILRQVLPVEAGFLESFLNDQLSETSTSTVGLSEDVMAHIMVSRPDEDPIALLYLMQTPPGQLLASNQVLTEEDWKRIDGYQALRARGYGGVGAMVLESIPHGSRTEYRYLALMLRGDTLTWTEEHRQIVSSLYDAIRRAFIRMAFPLLRRETILFQVADEQNLGLIVLDEQKRVRESNRRGWSLSLDYARFWGIQRDDVLTAFVEKILKKPLLRGSLKRLFKVDHTPDRLEVWEHHLAAEPHHLPAPRTLLVLRREPTVSPEWLRRSDLLTPHRKQIVEALIAPGATAQTVADHLGLSRRTVEKHVEKIYEILHVRNRAELIALVRGY